MGGGQVMGAAGQHVRDPQPHATRRGQRLHVPGGVMRLPEYQRSISLPFLLVVFSAHRSDAMSVPSRIRYGTPSPAAFSRASRSVGASAADSGLGIVADLRPRAFRKRGETLSSSSSDFPGLEDVDRLRELSGAPGATAELAQDAPGLELGITVARGVAPRGNLVRNPEIAPRRWAQRAVPDS